MKDALALNVPAGYPQNRLLRRVGSCIEVSLVQRDILMARDVVILSATVTNKLSSPVLSSASNTTPLPSPRYSIMQLRS